MLIGYASTRPHHGLPSDAQRGALLAQGCWPVFDDDGRASPADRPGLIDALSVCCTGDALAVWHVRTLGDSIDDIAWLLAHLGKRRIGLKTLTPWFFDLDPARPRVAHLVDVLRRHGDAAAQAVGA